ncbi:hypothetical protein KCU71_g24, partial [Aureobasidium melanogenum]
MSRLLSAPGLPHGYARSTRLARASKPCYSTYVLRRRQLGPLLLENFDDWTIAIILAQRDLRVLEFRLPITTESLAIYRKQCNALPTLDKLQQLFITFNVSAEKVMAALFSCTPNLTYLDVTIEHTPDGTSWSPDDTAFLAIGQLKHLRTLTICIGTSSTCDTGITCHLLGFPACTSSLAVARISPPPHDLRGR